eukprot:GHVS01106394.1.p1 GENE.GHVS01106394.1~~GHVS01106394.1.p1  ORF type:complete len:645 (-),score=88.21 GHVS01106394.1:2511-4445(-)
MTSNSSAQPLYLRCRSQLENLLRRRFFIAPSFEIYGGVSGLFDYGPPGCALKAEVEALWRQHFVLAENMLEISGPCLTPYSVLKTSGHVDRFTDLMTKDPVTHECFRADKLLEEAIDRILEPTDKKQAPPSEDKRKELELMRRHADAMTADELTAAFEQLDIRSPDGNVFSKPFPFNLMFGTKIGPKQAEDETQSKTEATAGAAFLRPETAQGIFVNFRRLLDCNGGKMPFAAAQIGLGFRNEIAPRNGLLRVREFQMAEIEHFVHPGSKGHPKFAQVQDMCLPLFSRKQQSLPGGQVEHNIPLFTAVASEMIANETLAFFLARTFLFLVKCGIQAEGIRFRQHLSTEMAHYACDCWDAEIHCSYGWIEVAGHADRAAFDLTHHSKETKVELTAQLQFETPRVVEVVQYSPDRKAMGIAFRKAQTDIHEAIEEMSDKAKIDIQTQLDKAGSYELKLCTGETYVLTAAMMKFTKEKKTVCEESYVPSVIEPSFGVGRIIHCILEHTFRSRAVQDQEERCYLSLPACVAPVKCSVLPISKSKEFDALVNQTTGDLTLRGLAAKSDSSGTSIGRRYARTDEIGTPFGITVDFQSLKDSSVTLRERDSMKQVRLQITEAVDAVSDIVQGRRVWEDVLQAYPLFVEQEV